MQAFIFDFDGVIVDSEKYWDEVQDSLLRKHVPNWRPELMQRFMGQSAHGVVEILNRECGTSLTVDAYLALINDAVVEIYEERCTLMPGFLELLERLEARNIPLGIASSSQRKWVEATLKRFELLPRFRIVVTGDDTPGRAKPLPDLYLLAAARLKADPTQCVAIEDSRNGIAAAKSAGMTCIALRSDLNPKEDLSQADTVVTHMDQVDVSAL